MHVENVRWYKTHIMCDLGSPNGTIESPFVCPSLSLELCDKSSTEGLCLLDLASL